MKVREILEGCSEWSCAEGYEELRPMVSVLLPTFRRAKSGLFETAVQSVLDQDFQNWELIIIDDGSTDGTAELIAHFMRNDRRISCIRHRYNVGLPAISEYEGYEKARGEYIAFIFDDNRWERDYLSRTINFMVRENAKAAYGRVHSYYGPEEEAFVELGTSNTGVGINMLPYTNIIANGGVILAKEVIETVGLYDPHIALTRLCDWHYWKRIVKKYEFYETGILAGIETGAMQKDSLGNSYQMSSWIAAEREASISDNDLLPQNYPNIAINEVSFNNTEMYMEWVENVYQSYSKKEWYLPEKPSDIIYSNARLRVLILASSFDASFELAFSCIIDGPSEFIVRCGNMATGIQEVAQADVVILIRNLVALGNYKKICEKLAIPCYLYIDDNMIELAKDNRQDKDMQLIRASFEDGRARELPGIFVSTKNLEIYFDEHGINSNLFCIEPYIGEMIYTFSDVRQDTFTFAYMGGPARDFVFLHTVVPALLKLAKEIHIRLVVPSRVNLNCPKGLKNFEVIQVPVSFSLELTLRRYTHYRPDILIHCGPQIKNNQYKTKNALINAVRIGAVLVASDVMPYNNDTQTGIGWLCVENTVHQWYEVLQDLCADAAKQEKLLKNASLYCQDHYRKEQIIQVLQQAFSEIRPAKHIEIVQRLNEAIFDVLYIKTMEQNLVATSGSSKPSRSLTEEPLSFTGGIPKAKSYQIRCKTETFSELGICFSAYGEAKGHVRIKISCKEGQLRECVLDLEEYTHDNWTYLSFDPIPNAMDQMYKIALEFEYDAGSAFVGVFENAKKRSFLYRLTNKLGCPIPVTDLLFADCR